jgi:hypothetical protein
MAFVAAALPYLQAAMAVVGAISAIQQGKSAKAAADYNARINEQNAGIARQEAADLARQQERENYLRLGAIHAAQGKSGGAAGEGSVLDVLGDTAAQGELERQNILYRGELKARGYTNTAALDRFEGSQAVSSSYMKAGTELLSGAASAYDTFGRIKRT